MKVKRQKHVRRTLMFYKNNFNVKPPFNVLLDGTFCKAALKFQVNISEQLPKYLDAEVKIMTTRCVIAECEFFGEMLYGPLKILKQYPVKDCGHETPQPPIKCLRRMVRGKKCSERFFIATQDALLSEKVRRVCGVPLLYISHKAITLEAPSDECKEVADSKVRTNLKPTTNEFATLIALKKKVFGEPTQNLRKKRRRKIVKGPNPLSCKTKKNKSSNAGAVASSSDEQGSGSRKKIKSRKGRRKSKQTTHPVTD